MAFDLLRGQTVLFGGFSIAAGAASAETWTFDGTTWTQATPATVPPARDTHAMAFDLGRGVVVMYGGVDTGNFPASLNAETWEWNGGDWTQAMPAAAPTARFGPAMAYDQGRGVMVLFGGSNGSTETWEYDGVTWTQATPSTTPPGRANHAMAYDPLRQTVVMTGGTAGSLTLADTWEYDGVDWVPIGSALTPPARAGHGMAFDLARGAVVMYGGRGPSLLADTWELRDGQWHEFQLTSGAGVAPRANFAMAYDLLRSEVVVFGGASGSGDIGETWTFAGSTPSFARYGVGCAGSRGVLRMRASTLPRLGTSFDLSVAPVATSSPVFLVWGLGGASNAPVPTAAAGCTQWVLPPLDALGTVATTASVAFSLAIPNNPNLAGLVANFQFVAFEPGGIVVSDAGRTVLW